MVNAQMANKIQTHEAPRLGMNDAHEKQFFLVFGAAWRSGNIWEHMAARGRMCHHLGGSENMRAHLASGIISEHLETFGNRWEQLEASDKSGSIWKHLEASGIASGHIWYPSAPGSIWEQMEPWRSVRSLLVSRRSTICEQKC